MATRREVLQSLIVSVGGASALAACGGAASVTPTSAGSPGRFYPDREMVLVSRISDLIIPRTETPGALDVNVPGYLDGLMVDWANDETRRSHLQALVQIGRDLDERAGGNFAASDQATAERALTELDAEAFSEHSDLGGYRRLKGFISSFYFSSEGGAVEELKWVAVPGRWDPAVKVSG